MLIVCLPSYIRNNSPLRSTLSSFISLAVVNLLTWSGSGVQFLCACFVFGLPRPWFTFNLSFDSSGVSLSLLCFGFCSIVHYIFSLFQLLTKFLYFITPACEIEWTMGGKWVAVESVADEACVSITACNCEGPLLMLIFHLWGMLRSGIILEFLRSASEADKLGSFCCFYWDGLCGTWLVSIVVLTSITI